MSKHISDQPRETGSGRMRAYLDHERQSGTHPSVEALRSRPHERAEDSGKTAEYMRIDRDQMSDQSA